VPEKIVDIFFCHISIDRHQSDEFLSFPISIADLDESLLVQCFTDFA
jgi:hypothetical protein